MFILAFPRSLIAMTNAVRSYTHPKISCTCKRMWIACLAFACLSLTAHAVHATPGDLDPSFGLVVTQIGNYGQGYAVAFQSDGRIVVVGYSQVGATNDFALIRYNPDGSLDSSFNGTGKVTTPITQNNDVARAVAIQPDGKIIVAGVAGSGSMLSFAVARYNSTGSLDVSFNGTGKVVTSVSGSTDIAYALAIQPNGKILIAGQAGTIENPSFAVVRYNSDGSLDTSFNGTGIVLTSNTSVAYDIALQPDGKIVAVGRAVVNGNYDFAIVRFNPTGSLDTTFNLTGIVITSLSPSSDEAFAVALQPDGKIVTAGKATIGVFHDFALARYNSNGTLDTSFNGTGKVITQIGKNNDEANGLVIQSNGKIVVAGYVDTSLANSSFAIARYNSNGSLDASFNGRGSFISSNSTMAYGVTLQPDGKIIAAGKSGFSSPSFAVARYLGDNKLNRIANFDDDNKSDVSIWNPTDHNWYVLSSVTSTIVIRGGWGNGELGDKIVPGDYDGDGRADFAVFRRSEGNWYISLSSDGMTLYRNWGVSTDIPVAGDYDLDGKTDVAVFRPSEGNWYILNSRDNAVTARHLGEGNDKPVPADYDGDGATDIAIYRPSSGQWYILNSRDGFLRVVQWGSNNDKPIPADFDGDGQVDVAIFRPTDGTWYVQLWTGNVIVKNWGTSTDVPVPTDYDGDGIADIGVYRSLESNWYIIESSTNTMRLANLEHGGIPVPSGYYPL